MSEFAPVQPDKAFSLAPHRRYYLLRYPSNFDLKGLDGASTHTKLSLHASLFSQPTELLEAAGGSSLSTATEPPSHSIFDSHGGKLRRLEGVLTVGVKAVGAKAVERKGEEWAEDVGLPVGRTVAQPEIVKKRLSSLLPVVPEETKQKKRKNK